MTTTRVQNKGNRKKKSRSTPPRKEASRDNRVGAFDRSIRFLLQRRPRDFIAFGAGDQPVRVLRPISEALPALGRDIDGGYLVRLGKARVKVVAHIELHRRHQSRLELGQDVLEAQTRIFKREGLPALSLVFDLYGKEGEPVWNDEEMVFGVGLGHGQASRCMYRRVNLRGMKWRELLDLPMPTLWALVPLTQGGAEAEAVVAARDAIQRRRGLSEVEQADQLAVLRFMAEAEGFAGEVVQEYIRREAIMQSTLYQEIIKEGIVKGEKKGIAKGEKKGIVKGEVRKAAQVILKQLRKRLGIVDEPLMARVQAEQDPEVLDRWLDEALEAVDADSARRLALHIREAPAAS